MNKGQENIRAIAQETAVIAELFVAELQRRDVAEREKAADSPET